MYRFWMAIFIVAAPYLFGQDEEWIEKVSRRIDSDAVQWAEEHVSLQDFKRALEVGEGAPPCLRAFNGTNTIESDMRLYVFMSFSVPISIWQQLSQLLEKIGGAFVLRGLPGNSFQDYSEKVQEMTTMKIRAPILVDPLLFSKYEIQAVPAFLIEEPNHFDLIAGNISLVYALDYMSRKGETVTASLLGEHIYD